MEIEGNKKLQTEPICQRQLKDQKHAHGIQPYPLVLHYKKALFQQVQRLSTTEAAQQPTSDGTCLYLN